MHLRSNPLKILGPHDQTWIWANQPITLFLVGWSKSMPPRNQCTGCFAPTIKCSRLPENSLYQQRQTAFFNGRRPNFGNRNGCNGHDFFWWRSMHWCSRQALWMEQTKPTHVIMLTGASSVVEFPKKEFN